MLVLEDAAGNFEYELLYPASDYFLHRVKHAIQASRPIEFIAYGRYIAESKSHFMTPAGQPEISLLVAHPGTTTQI